MKKLLKESEIRRMMKFANIGSLTNGFVEKLNETSLYGETDSLYEQEDDLDAAAPEDAPDAPPPEELPDDTELDVDDDALDVEDELGGDTGAALKGVETIMQAVKMGLEEMGMEEVAAKIDVEMTSAAEEPGLEEPGLEEPGLGEPGMEGPPPEEELEEEGLEMMEDEALVNEVVRRVAKRLLKRKRR